MLKLKFNNEWAEVRENDNGLFCMNDIYKASGLGRSKEPSKFFTTKRGQEILSSVKYSNTAGVKEAWVDKLSIYKYASWIDDKFYNAVFKAFEASAGGDSKKAIDIATSVAIPQELIEREKLLRAKMMELLTGQFEGRKLTNMITNYNRLLGKAVSGYTPKELTDGVASTFKYIIEKGHLGGVSAYLATLEMINTGLVAGLDYQTIALMLQVETTKNKKLMKQVAV